MEKSKVTGTLSVIYRRSVKNASAMKHFAICPAETEAYYEVCPGNKGRCR